MGLDHGVCAICGKHTDLLYETRIEGAVLNVCVDCSKMGKIIRKVDLNIQDVPEKINDFSSSENFIEVLVSNYGFIIKKKRESLGLTQKELAGFLGIKESLLHKIESNHFEPDISLARDLEKKLHIVLVENVPEVSLKGDAKNDSPLTLGDLLKKKIKNE